jgi:hypothetical protein
VASTVIGSCANLDTVRRRVAGIPALRGGSRSPGGKQEAREGRAVTRGFVSQNGAPDRTARAW